jgi:hypothetical protein
VTRAWDFEKNIEKPNPKTAAGVRYVPIEFELMPLLRDLCTGLGADDYLFPTLPPPEDWADTFRDHLRRAGVARTKLFENSATVKNITLYDLRATGITWRTLRGDDARIIQRAAGHEKYATTDGYVREASVFKGRIGDPFPALPKEFRSRVPITLSGSGRIDARKVASPRGFEHATNGLFLKKTRANPHPRPAWGVRIAAANHAEPLGRDHGDHCDHSSPFLSAQRDDNSINFARELDPNLIQNSTRSNRKRIAIAIHI